MTPPIGVQFTAPPMSLLAEATGILAAMTAQLPPDAHGAVIGIATTTGWNAAVVHRVGGQFQIGSWIGKSWHGGLTGGAAVRATW